MWGVSRRSQVQLWGLKNSGHHPRDNTLWKDLWIIALTTALFRFPLFLYSLCSRLLALPLPLSLSHTRAHTHSNCFALCQATLSVVNVSALPDKGERLRSQVKDLEDALDSLSLTPLTEPGEEASTRHQDAHLSDDPLA